MTLTTTDLGQAGAAIEAEEARKVIEGLRGLLRDLRVTFLPDVERLDALSEQFYRQTGWMAPGKSVPLEMSNSQPKDEDVMLAWAAFIRERRDGLLLRIDAALGGKP